MASQTEIGSIAAHDTAVTAFKMAELAGSRLLEADALLQLGRTDGPLVYPSTAYAHLKRAELIFRANGDMTKAALCSIGRARALYDMGRERSGALVAQEALAEPLLPVRASLAALGAMALCHAHLGELDVAMAVLDNRARPLVKSSGSPAMQGYFLRSLAIVQVHMMVCRREPELWLWHSDGSTTPFESPVPQPNAVLALLDQLQALMPLQAPTGYICLLRLFVAGLFLGDDNSIEGLYLLTEQEHEIDPPLACWTLYFRALLLIHRKERSSAIAALDEALRLARRWQLTRMVRDIQLQLSRVHESAGDLRSSIEEFRQFAPLKVQSTLREPPNSSQEEPAQPHRLRDLMPGYVKRAVRFIEDSIQVPLGVEQVAEYCGVSRRTLEIAFVETTSMTIANYIKRCKLEHAANLLLDAERPIRDTAAAVGYRWPAAFSRDFQLHFGASPSDWRRLRFVNRPEA